MHSMPWIEQSTNLRPLIKESLNSRPWSKESMNLDALFMDCMKFGHWIEETMDLVSWSKEFVNFRFWIEPLNNTLLFSEPLNEFVGPQLRVAWVWDSQSRFPGMWGPWQWNHWCPSLTEMQIPIHEMGSKFLVRNFCTYNSTRAGNVSVKVLFPCTYKNQLFSMLWRLWDRFHSWLGVGPHGRSNWRSHQTRDWCCRQYG